MTVVIHKERHEKLYEIRTYLCTGSTIKITDLQLGYGSFTIANAVFVDE